MLSLVKIILIILSLLTSNSVVDLAKKPYRNPITDPEIEDFYTLLGMTVIQICLYEIVSFLAHRYDKKTQENSETNVNKIDENHIEEQHIEN